MASVSSVDIILNTLFTILLTLFIILLDWFSARSLISDAALSQIESISQKEIEPEKLAKIIEDYRVKKAASATWGIDLAVSAVGLDFSAWNISLTYPEIFPFFSQWNAGNINRESQIWFMLIFIHLLILAIMMYCKYRSNIVNMVGVIILLSSLLLLSGVK